MLEGIQANEIIVGAYTDRSGRVCPMLAAHRHGGRTSLASFARAWDRYTCARRPRPATDRELRTLRAMLEASLWHDEPDLAAAAAEHRATVEASAPERERLATGERNRFAELRHRAGWAWLRVFRRYDDYAAALAQVESESRAADRERELV
jgi:N-acyl-D-aspartate/D-glutamate deacylase